MSVNLWGYLAANPWGSVALVLACGWVLARLVRAWRDRRPVRVRLVLVCPACGREDEAGETLQ